MKKITSLFISLFLVAGFLVLPQTQTTNAGKAFPDVADNHPNATAIEYVKNQGYVGGYENGNYGPDDTITRAAFTKIVVLAKLGKDPDVEAKDCFPDVKVGDWFHGYVCWAFFNEIIKGYPNGTFQGWLNINFAEAAKIMSLAFSSDAVAGAWYETPKAMAAGEAPWYQDPVNELADKKAIPMDITSFTMDLTRAQLAEMIYRVKANVTNLPSQTYASIESAVQAASSTTQTPAEGSLYTIRDDAIVVEGHWNENCLTQNIEVYPGSFVLLKKPIGVNFRLL